MLAWDGGSIIANWGGNLLPVPVWNGACKIVVNVMEHTYLILSDNILIFFFNSVSVVDE